MIVNNTVANPNLIQPLKPGVGLVIHLATKLLGGRGTVISATIVDGREFATSKKVENLPGQKEPETSYHGASYRPVLGDVIA